ncbi:hypothetical protein TNCT_725881 [Trichonephila clavata]|uniref:Uncharacterized protein n=1 Tax=Trichonephila clavata TaxID=2740835 RepID=A0A8X6L5W9_TRICU|nr:hypothetical protein TNCT_725881 [Trichonephila clavata]
MQDPTQPLLRCRSKERDKSWCQRVKNSVSNPRTVQHDRHNRLYACGLTMMMRNVQPNKTGNSRLDQVLVGMHI